MDVRKKILLATEDVKTRALEDIYIDISLSKNNREIIPDKYDNTFDIETFYKQERFNSRDFVIYGTISSTFYDCNNLKISVFQSPDLNENSLLLETISSDIVNENMPFKNIYNKIKGKYIIKDIPTTFTGCSVYLKFETQDPQQYVSYTEKQQLIFTTLTFSNTGERVVQKLEYGLNEAIIDCDGNIIQVNNDFDFFYNKHWIKKDVAVLDLNKTWIRVEDSKVCELTNELFRGRNVGIRNTGNFFYNEIKEVYPLNNFPTGESQVNLPELEEYIPPFPSNGECSIREECSFSFNVEFIPADSNTFVTAPQVDVSFSLNPEDDVFLQEEEIIIANTSTSQHYSFVRYKTNDSTYSTEENLNFFVEGDVSLVAEMQEVAPYSLTLNNKLTENLQLKDGEALYEASTYKEWLEENNYSPNEKSFTDFLESLTNFPAIISPEKNRFYEGEFISLSNIKKEFNQDMLVGSFYPHGNYYDIIKFTLIEFKINGNSINLNDFGDTIQIGFVISENKVVELLYKPTLVNTTSSFIEEI